MQEIRGAARYPDPALYTSFRAGRYVLECYYAPAGSSCRVAGAHETRLLFSSVDFQPFAEVTRYALAEFEAARRPLQLRLIDAA